MKVGARTIKTGLAVAVTVFLVNILEIRFDAVEYNIAGMAAITAIIGMQPSIKGSLETFKNRVHYSASMISFTHGKNVKMMMLKWMELVHYLQWCMGCSAKNAYWM